MRVCLPISLGAILIALIAATSCDTREDRNVWKVEEMEIPLYHSSTVDPESGASAHIEYCAAKLSRGSVVVHIVYRPIDFLPGRNPGFAKGDAVKITGLEKVKDFGGMDGVVDYWIHDITIEKSNQNSAR